MKALVSHLVSNWFSSHIFYENNELVEASHFGPMLGIHALLLKELCRNNLGQSVSTTCHSWAKCILCMKSTCHIMFEYTFFVSAGYPSQYEA